MANSVKENKQELERLIQKIAVQAAELFPQDWYCAALGYFLAGEEYNEHQQISVLCESSQDYVDIMKDAWDDFDTQDVILDIRELFVQMREICKSVGDNWVEATLVLKRSGAFEMNYVYEPITEYDNFFIEDWKSTYLV